MGNVLSSMARLAFCSQGAACAKLSRPTCDSASNWRASASPTQPDSATHDGSLTTEPSAACRLAGLPSVSSTRCSMRRPRSPPRRLMSCQAAREPMRKSRDTSCWAADMSTHCVTTRPAAGEGDAIAQPGAARLALVMALVRPTCCSQRRRFKGKACMVEG